jgi:hypothetical protein
MNSMVAALETRKRGATLVSTIGQKYIGSVINRLISPYFYGGRIKVLSIIVTAWKGLASRSLESFSVMVSCPI